MALIAANGMRVRTGPNRQFSGVTSVAGGHGKECLAYAGSRMNWSAGWHKITGVTDRASVPSGARHPVAWLPARKAGGLTSRNAARINVATGTLNLAAGRNLAGAVTITLTAADADLQLVVSASGSASFSLTASPAVLAGVISAAGSASLSITAADANLGAIVSAIGAATFSLTGEGTATAIGHLSGDITPFTELSPQSLAAAVWDALAASFNEPGSMGALMNGGAAGGLTTEQATQLLEIFQRLGLDAAKPLTQTATEISTPDWTLEVAEPAAGTVTVTRQ